MTDMPETIAKHVFEAMRFERLDETPDWVDGGNSNAQVEARRVAQNIIDTVSQVKVKPLVWQELGGDARLRSCASEGCGQHVSWRMEIGGVGSEYCDPCKKKIETLLPPLSDIEGEG